MERKYGRDAILTPSNLISLGRIISSIFLIEEIIKKDKLSWGTLVRHSTIAATDIVDGKLARKQGTTELGESLDQISDKFQVLGELTALAKKGKIPWLPVALIGFREAAVTFYRQQLKSKGIDSPSSGSGKLKTWSQQIALGIAVAPKTAENKKLVKSGLWVAVGLSALSALDIFEMGRFNKKLKKLEVITFTNGS